MTYARVNHIRFKMISQIGDVADKNKIGSWIWVGTSLRTLRVWNETPDQ